MTIIEPIPDLQWGKGDWQDYISNWREKDAEYLQARTILRYQSTAARDNAVTGVPSPGVGQAIYNDETKTLEMWRSPGVWARSLMFQYLTSGTAGAPVDTASAVNVSHTGAAGKGITFAPTQVSIDTATVNIGNGLLTTTANNMALQTPAQKKATLSTNATELVSDTPIAAPGLRLTAGTLNAAGLTTTVGALSATSLALGTGPITGAGAITSGPITSSGTITGTTLAISGTGNIGGASGVVFNGTWIAAPQGFVANAGYFNGDSSQAIMAYRNSTNGAVAAAQLTADSTRLNLRGGQGMLWWNAAGQGVAWISPVIVSGTDPGAANYPDGTIWIVP